MERAYYESCKYVRCLEEMMPVLDSSLSRCLQVLPRWSDNRAAGRC